MKISTLGFPHVEEQKLGKILMLAKTHSYSLHQFQPDSLPDILLVFGDASNFKNELDGLTGIPTLKIVVVTKQAPLQSDYFHLPFPLVASRVLRVLDTVVDEEQLLHQDSQIEQAKENQILAPEPLTPIIQVPALPDSVSTSVEESTPLYKVLVVDDSLPMQKALSVELEKMTVSVAIDFVENGEDALEKTQDQLYDFIFLDIMMPGIDGFETCTRMRQRPHMKKVPIIMLTAKNSPLDEVKGVISGCTTYLIKPIVHEEFQKVMARITKWVDNFNQQGQVAGRV